MLMLNPEDKKQYDVAHDLLQHFPEHVEKQILSLTVKSQLGQPARSYPH